MDGFLPAISRDTTVPHKLYGQVQELNLGTRLIWKESLNLRIQEVDEKMESMMRRIMQQHCMPLICDMAEDSTFK